MVYTNDCFAVSFSFRFFLNDYPPVYEYEGELRQSIIRENHNFDSPVAQLVRALH
jgi:hypothetical protein